jgi:hypothetical protein
MGRARDPVVAVTPVDTADHALIERATIHGVEVTCSCGDFDGWYNGARSRRYVLAHYEEHVRDAGPLHVTSHRADEEQP